MHVYLEYLGHGRSSSQTLHKMHEVFTLFLMPNISLVVSVLIGLYRMSLMDDLEHIALYFPNTTLNAKPLLRDGTFPNLRGLRCCFRITRESVGYVAGFMMRHPNIETLHWDVTSREGVANSVFNTLPKLREISGDNQHVAAFLEHRSESPRPLHSITNVSIDSVFWESVRPSLDAVRILKLDVEQFGCIGDIYRLAKDFPNLIWLRVDLSDMIWDDTIASLRMMKNVSAQDLDLHIILT